MVNQKKRMKMNMTDGNIDWSVSGQVSLHINLEGNHKLNM